MAEYGKKASDKVEAAMHELQRGTLKSGSTGAKVTSRRQAIAIGLSQAAQGRREGSGRENHGQESGGKEDTRKENRCHGGPQDGGEEAGHRPQDKLLMCAFV